MQDTTQSLFYVKSEQALDRLPDWLKATSYNRVKSGLRDKKGQLMFGLTHNGDKSGIVVCADDALADRTFDVIEAHQEAYVQRTGGNR